MGLPALRTGKATAGRRGRGRLGCGPAGLEAEAALKPFGCFPADSCAAAGACGCCAPQARPCRARRPALDAIDPAHASIPSLAPLALAVRSFKQERAALAPGAVICPEKTWARTRAMLGVTAAPVVG